MSATLYPMQFEPILKERIWGGQKLKTLLNKPITSEITGESWELSTVKGDISIIANGIYKGKLLTEIIESEPEQLLGSAVHKQFGTEFPLLFKYLDAREDLSIQVHPNDELAKKRHNSFGKTEMWYVMQADPNSRIIVGFKQKSSPEAYLESLKDNSIISLLDTIMAKPGDVFFLETGTVHAIGAGLLIAEIQQTSDITYRIYDFDRKDAHGNTRELHVEQALEAINYNPVDSKKSYSEHTNKSNPMVDCPYFTTNFIPLHGKMAVSHHGESFRVLMCTEGSFSISTDDDDYSYQTGDTVLLPAVLQKYVLEGKASLLEIYIS